MCNCLPSTLPNSILKSNHHITPFTIFSPQKLNQFPLHKSKIRIKNEELGFKEFEISTKPQEIDDHISSNSFDFLEYKEKEIKDSDSDLDSELEELVQVGSSGEGDELIGVMEEEIGDIVERKEVKNRRVMVRRSNMIAKQVISIQSACNLGFVSQIWVDTCSWVVLVVEVRPSMLSGEMERFLLEDVRQVGDVVLVEDESVLEEDIKMLGLDTLVGYNVVTPSRQSIGKVRGFTFNINSGAVQLLELDSFGISLIPSSLVTTYGLLVEDVIDVEPDTLVVHEDAASSLQRLTKGIWDTPTMETYKDELEEYPEFERRTRAQAKSRRNSRKFTSKDDDLPLPMDYL